MAYVYIRSESTLWTVGFYGPDGGWQPESDHESREEAAERVHYLNGGHPIEGCTSENPSLTGERCDCYQRGYADGYEEGEQAPRRPYGA